MNVNFNFIGYPNCINTSPIIDLPCRQEAGQDLAQVNTSLGHRVGRGTREDGAAALHLSVGWM